jgi:predicted DNA-binding transcriptional regulator YafY
MRQALRIFRLDRISGLEQCDNVFDLPAGFDIKTYLHQAMPFVQSAYNVEV